MSIEKNKWIPALSVINNLNNDAIRVGDKIKLYGEETVVDGFYFSYNEGISGWETVIKTTGRCDPLERSLKQIEIQESWAMKESVPELKEVIIDTKQKNIEFAAKAVADAIFYHNNDNSQNEKLVTALKMFAEIILLYKKQ